MGNTKIIPRGFGPVLVLVPLAGVVGGLGQWWADGGSQAVQLTRCGALLAEAWEAAVVEEVLFRGVLLWACLSWARRRNEAYPRRASRARRFAGLRAVVDPVGFAVMTSSLIFGLAHLFPEGSLMAPGADIGVAAIQGVLKVAQATLFGAVMALLVVRSPTARVLSRQLGAFPGGTRNRSRPFRSVVLGPSSADGRRAAFYLSHGQRGRSRTFGDHNGSAGMGRKIMLGFAHEQN